MRKAIILTLIAALFLSAALAAKKTPAQQLQTTLNTWKQFRWEGIIQVQMSAFSARKNFVLARNENELRLDVLDTGIMGLQAKPLATIYLKDNILVEAPTIQQLADIDLNWFVPQGAVKDFVHFTDSLQAHSKDILAKRRANTPNATYYFDKKFRLTKISSDDLSVKAEIIYNQRSKPTKLLLDHSGDRIVELQINEQKSGNVKIEPLKVNSEIILPDTTDNELSPAEGKFFELNLDDPNLAALLDSLNLKDLKLSELIDSLKLGDLKLQDLNLDSLAVDSLKLDLKEFKDLNLDQLLEKLKLNDLTIKELLKDLHPEDIKLEDLLKGMKLEDLNLDELGIQLE